MSEGENGVAPTTEAAEQQSHPSTIGMRSASPAKRSAADMEGEKQLVEKPPGSFTQLEETGPTDFDAAMSGMTPTSQAGGDLQTQATTATSSMATSTDGSMDTAATSVQSEQQSPETTLPAARKEPHSPERMAEQVAHVQQLSNTELDEGTRGVVISNKWLSRVLSRIPGEEKSSKFPKDAREGLVGPLDNSDILAPGAYDSPVLKDLVDSDYIPLQPGLQIGQDFEIVPKEAYAYIIGEYGYHPGQKTPPYRYAHDTAETGASDKNIIYEIYPPVITIRKMPQPSGDQEASKPNSSLGALRLKTERKGRGQLQEDDAAVLVAAKTERFQKFLTRAKEAAGIPLSTKVKVWRVLDPSSVAVDNPDNVESGVLSPPASRPASPSKLARTKLVVGAEKFAKLEVGKDIEEVDVKDETNNDKYNGKSQLRTVGLFDNSITLILEEQKGGPAGGEFASDSLKPTKRVLGKKNGSKAGSAPGSGRSSPAPSVMARGRPTLRKDGRTRGCTGLTNLGNTCYMNSALQCIRSVEELACYFLDGSYKREINNDNPLGHHGQMAKAYAGVLQGIYDSSLSAFGPQEFKKTLGKLQPMFSGYGQQDSQEFLSFLVDALHEDLNRIKKKPYLENPDSDDSKVKDPEYIRELGEVYRSNHHKRNDSIAMDLFSGFYKNTMECPDCDKVSVTFDPYSLLTVQLPMDHAFQHSICFVPLHGKPVIHEIDMDKMFTIKKLKEYLASKHPGADASKMWMAEVWSHKLYKVFDDNMTLAEASIATNDYVFIYELDDVPRNAPTGKKTYSQWGQSKSEDVIPPEGMDSAMADVFAVPILSRAPGKYSSSSDGVLCPLYITLTREEAKDYDTIVKKILLAVANITSRPILKEFAEDTAPPAARDADETKDVGMDDSAGVSDHSAQSEEDYVNVSLGKPSASANGASPMQVDEPESHIPESFMDPQYFLSPALRNQLFDVKYLGGGDNGLHCTNTTIGGLRNELHSMFDRVKLPARRPSVQSTASEESTSTSGSGNHGNEESEESDADDDDDNNFVIGGEQPLSTETVEDSDDELARGNNYNAPRSGRGNKNRRQKHKNKGRRKNRTYGKKNNALFSQNRSMAGVSLNGKQEEDSPYYIQLGEAIVLDWRPEAFDGLFEGSETDADEMRGHRIVDDTGRSGPVYQDEQLQVRKSKRAERKKHGVTLEDCFAETGKKERLSEDNAWYCNQCKELRQAYKQLDIWTLPDILVVHMKRFGGGRAMRDKIDILVDYPIEGLDMNDKVGLKEDGKEYIYDLFAVDCHYGGLGGGHYTAMAKNFFDGKWYNYNDSSMSSIRGEAELTSPAAYLLFYRRRSATPLGPPELQRIVTEYRNPPEPASGDDAEESEPGEGRLGGPVHSSQHQHGSSSALAGAGVGGMNSSLTEHNGANGFPGADSPLTTRQTMTTNRIYDAEADWSFDNLEDAAPGNGDNESTKAEMDDMDRDSTLGMDDGMSIGSTGVNNSPNNLDDLQPFDDEGEDYGAYHQVENAPLLLEEEDPKAVDIHPDVDVVDEMD